MGNRVSCNIYNVIFLSDDDYTFTVNKLSGLSENRGETIFFNEIFMAKDIMKFYTDKGIQWRGVLMYQGQTGTFVVTDQPRLKCCRKSK